ncbi:hypothetical protein CIB84_012026 [Bambusicola thoracicus]|uniref:Uncharacterized protein n=1 Tax=Bambusicola thoracicus TaxID=9083 RepID=A0A2P4SJE9_BAMTH|nr:hypothetical protein CIB84_012026 [Bambusicola thoracicus]
MAAPHCVGCLCHSLWPTAAMSPVWCSAPTRRWSSTLRQWLSPFLGRSSAPSLSRALWGPWEPPKLEVASAVPRLLGACRSLGVPGGLGGTQLGAVNRAELGEELLEEEHPGDAEQNVDL